MEVEKYKDFERDKVHVFQTTTLMWLSIFSAMNLKDEIVGRLSGEIVNILFSGFSFCVCGES